MVWKITNTASFNRAMGENSRCCVIFRIHNDVGKLTYFSLSPSGCPVGRLLWTASCWRASARHCSEFTTTTTRARGSLFQRSSGRTRKVRPRAHIACTSAACKSARPLTQMPAREFRALRRAISARIHRALVRLSINHAERICVIAVYAYRYILAPGAGRRAGRKQNEQRCQTKRYTLKAFAIAPRRGRRHTQEKFRAIPLA